MLAKHIKLPIAKIHYQSLNFKIGLKVKPGTTKDPHIHFLSFIQLVMRNKSVLEIISKLYCFVGFPWFDIQDGDQRPSMISPKACRYELIQLTSVPTQM